MGKLAGKTALITGAAGEIGHAIVAKFLEEGVSSLLLVDRDKAALQAMQKSLSAENIEIFECDVTKAAQMAGAFEEAIKLWGRLDITVLNAGVEGSVARITDYEESDFDQVMDVNVKGTWLGLKYAVGVMVQSGGSIIAVSSVAGQRGIAQSSAYVASKHAVIGMVKSVSAEVGSKALRVNAVCPSPVDTRMMRSLEEGAMPGETEKAKSIFEKKMLLRRYANTSEVANMIAFLASDEAIFCTGNSYNVDGGYTTC